MKYLLLSSSLESFVQLITVLIIFAFVLFLTYYGTKWMASFQKKSANNKNLKIVETIGAGNNKLISIVKVGTKYIVVAVGKEEVNYLCDIKEEELEDLSFLSESSVVSTQSFSAVFDKMKKKAGDMSRRKNGKDS